MKPLPAIAPRGKEFAVARVNQVVGPKSVVVLQRRWSVLADASKACDALDQRLSPVVILVEITK